MAENIDIFENEDSVEVTGAPGVDQVFTQIITSPDFRSMIRVEDVPPKTLEESRRVFDYMLQRGTLDNAIGYLVDTFGRATMFPAEKSLGADPRTQIISGTEESFDQGIGSLPK